MFIKRDHMLARGVFGSMAFDRHQFQIDLKRRIAQKSGQLCLCRDLSRHQIEQQNTQGTDILCTGPLI